MISTKKVNFLVFKKSNLVVLFVLFFNVLEFESQMIYNPTGEVFSDDPFFNTKFILSNNLKSLNGIISSKKELGAIQSSRLVQGYKYNSKGELSCQYSSKLQNRKRDTSFTYYKYNNDGKLILKRISDSYGFYSYAYEYDSLGQMSKNTFSREKNIGNSKSNFKLGKQYVIFSETYKYKKTDSSIVKIIWNNNQRPYQKNTYKYDSLGYLKEERTQLLINNKIHLTRYYYNEKGGLKKMESFKQKSKEPYKTIKYQYDDWGNITYFDEYKDGVQVIHKEILYDQSTLVLKTILSQDLVSKLITITKFKPKFYN
tara:strand:+ start:414 stop:1352 length:939 start_codon:yes stop_codon:yes gene_type:complete